MEYAYAPEQMLQQRISALTKREAELLDELTAVAEERAKREDQWMRLREQAAARAKGAGDGA